MAVNLGNKPLVGIALGDTDILGSSMSFVSCGATNNGANGLKTTPVNQFNSDLVSVTNNIMTFKKKCTCILWGGHTSTGSSGPSGGTARTNYEGTHKGQLSNGFNGYTQQSWQNSVELTFNVGDTLKMTSTTANGSSSYASVTVYFVLYVKK